MRFYEIDSGEILLDGVNIKDINCDDLRDLVGIVLQDTILFTDTIRNNLAYACPDATDREVAQAAEFSHCRQMIMGLPHRFRTRLTESGDNLSQGQRQLIAIGRAFLSYPNILILDEATSNIDTETEQWIQEAVARLMKGRTSIMVAHRLSTIQHCDRIIVMHHGRIRETGTHQELLALDGIYKKLYQFFI
jgi:ATP-binding cassette subfamily B protein